MAAFIRKQYAGAAAPTTTTSVLTDVGTSVTIASTTGWPSLEGIPFYVVIEPGSANEEKCLATRSGSTLTLTRAQDDTTAVAHNSGSSIYPVFTANDADEANEVASKLTTKGDILVTDGSGLYRLAVGANGYFLKANSSAAYGVEWGSIPTINSLDDVGDVTISSVEGGDFLVYNSSASVWNNETIHFITVSDSMPTDEVANGDLWYDSLTLELYIRVSGAWIQLTDDSFPVLGQLDDVYLTDPAAGDVLTFNGLEWENAALQVALGTNTTGNYMTNIVGGTGVTVIHTPGEGSTASVSVGQDVGTSSSVTFAQVTAPLTGSVTGNASTASALQTARTIALTGDVAGSVSFDGSASVAISTTIQPNSIALGTDTTGNYVSDISGGTGITVTHTPGEGSSASVSLSASVDSLSDTVITNPLIDQSLVYDGTNWINMYAPVATYAKNADATTLNVGEVVYLFSAAGDRASVRRASNISDTTSSKTIGVVEVGGAPGADVTIVTQGYVSGINLGSYTAGDILWLGSTAGTFTTTKPSAPNHLVFIGVVARANSGNGIMYVKCQNGYELDELHDVAISGLASGDFLKYNGSTWVNDPINLGTDTTGDYVASLVAGTGITLSNNSGEGATPTIAIGQNVATSSSVTFAKVTVQGNLDVQGTITRVNETNLELADSFIYLNATSASVNPDFGFAANYYDGTYKHAGVFRDASDGVFKVFEGYTPEPQNPINVSDASYNDAPLQAKRFVSTQTNGTAPLSVSSSTVVTNLNADKLDGQDGSYYAPLNSPTFTGTVTLPNNTVALGTQTTGNYVSDLSGGTGVTVVHTPSEGSTPTVSIGQAVETSASVTFAAVTAPLIGNASTATTLQNSRTISLGGDLSGSVSFNGSTDVTITATVQPNSVALGTDTTGNYMSDVTAGTGITITHTPGEGSNATITNAGVTSVNGSSGAITGVVTTSDTGTITSTMIADGTIVNADISSSAAIDASKITTWENDQVILSGQIFG